jgi:hypothetical protein
LLYPIARRNLKLMVFRGEFVMKRKGHPNIPDFSTKRAAPPAPDGHAEKPKQPQLPTVHGGKPHSTSKKSGRRGG